MISVSPYFTDGKTIKLVKFLGFDESHTDLTDAKLLIGIAMFLRSCKRRGERIRAMHPVTVDRLKVADVDRNIKMLQRMVRDAVQNTVIVITGDDIEESKLPGGLTGLGLGKPLRYDGTQLSALMVLGNTKKAPILLDLGNEIPRYTGAGRELIRHIRALLTPNLQNWDNELGVMIEEEENKNKVKQLEAERRQLRVALSRLEQRDDWKVEYGRLISD